MSGKDYAETDKPCSKCGTLIPPAAKFCLECGSQQKTIAGTKPTEAVPVPKSILFIEVPQAKKIIKLRTSLENSVELAVSKVIHQLGLPDSGNYVLTVGDKTIDRNSMAGTLKEAGFRDGQTVVMRQAQPRQEPVPPLEKVKFCPHCKGPLRLGAKFCLNDGTPVKSVLRPPSDMIQQGEPRVCAVCGHQLRRDSKFCLDCGESINGVQSKESEIPGQDRFHPQPASKFCIQCGKPLRQGAKFCLACGAAVRRRTE